jgi:hypothetical protein
MKPNDMPLIRLPLGLRDRDVATLIDFLYELTEALERHYTAELIRRNYPRQDNSTEDRPDTNPTDPPF